MESVESLESVESVESLFGGMVVRGARRLALWSLGVMELMC